MLSATIVPHCHQLLSALDAPTVSQRDRITADDAIGSLDVLYEFGELDALAPLEKMNRPVMLFGPYSSYIGNATGPKASKWKDQLVDGSIHGVVESCEPSSGLRWCRTYFLKHGTEDKVVQEVKKLHDELSGITTTLAEEKNNEEKNGSDNENDGENDQIVSASVDYYPSIKPHNLNEIQSSLAVLNRMQQLYVKLWLHLRRIVHDVFLLHHDVLEAGTEIQQRLVNVFSGNYSSYANQLDHLDDISNMQESIQLLPHEKLQLHMDCMNALGEVITVDDVDDMGGACWTYIRASVHGIYLTNPADANQVGAVAVGDTFLFAPLSTRFGHANQKQVNGFTGIHAVSPFLTDHCCITSGIPYYQSYIGHGAEEEYARLVQYCSKHNATLSPLQVGRSLDFSTGSSTTNISIITDHPVLPNFDADLKLYSSGFIMERMNGQVCLPLVISFAHHVECSYSIDFQDCFQQIKEQILLPYLQQANNSNHKENLVDDLMASIISEVPSGYLIVYKLKKLQNNSKYTAFDRLLPNFHQSANGDRHVGLCLKYSSSSTSSSSSSNSIPATVTEHWRAAMRMYDVSEHKGKDVKIPRALLQSFLTLLDRWMTPSIHNTDYYLSMDQILQSRSSTSATSQPQQKEEEVQKLSYCDMVSYANDYHIRFGLPGEGITSMRCMYAISEAQRLSSFDFQSLLFTEEDEEESKQEKKTAEPNQHTAVSMMVAGLAGSGIEVLGSQLYQQLQGNLDSSYTTEMIKVDFTQLFDNTHDLKTNKAKIKSFIDGKMKFALRNGHGSTSSKKLLLFIVLVISPQYNGRFTDLITFLASVSQSRVVNVTAVISPEQTFAQAENVAARTDVCLGLEYSHAIGLELIAPSGGDAVIVIEHNSSSASFAKLRSYIRRINPTIQSMRLNPTNLNLMEEDIQYFIQQIHNGFDVHDMKLTEREACCMSLGYPSPLLQDTLGKDALSLDCGASIYAVPDAPASIRLFKLSPSSVGVSQWSLSSVLKLLSFLFPQAKTGSNAVMHFWSAVSSPKQGFQRLLQIASAKVLSEKHHREIDRQYNNWIQSIVNRKKEEIEAIKAGLISIHGTLYLHNESLSFSTTKMDQNVLQASTSKSAQSCLLVEGNEGFVSIREKADYAELNQSPTDSSFTLIGSFSKEALFVLQELFKACEKFQMTRKKLLRQEETNKYEKIRIQALKRFKDRPLPAGWWFDGHFFVDHRGDNSELRPDIENIVEEYIQHENMKITDYNTLLNDLGY